MADELRTQPTPPAARVLRGEVLLDAETRKRINRAHFRRTISVFTALCVIGLVVAVYISPIFRVQHIEVQGTVNMDVEEVEEMVTVNGDSMITADFSDAKNQIAEHPLVRSVDVERDWPNTLKVTVVERVPWATWQAGESVHAIDLEGYVLPDVAPPAGLVIRHTDANNPLADGEQVDSAAISLATLLLQHVPPRLLLGITAMDWSSTGGMTIETDAGYRVAIGDSDDLNYKLSVWAQIDASVGRDKMSGHVLDLRFGDRPSLQ